MTTPETRELRLTWPLPEEWTIEQDRVGRDPHDVVDQAPGFTASDLDDLRNALGGGSIDVSVSPASIGKGASGYGVTVAVTILSVAGGISGLLHLGEYALKAITTIRTRTGSSPTIHDPDTLGAVAAASAKAHAPFDLTGCHYVGTVPITARPEAGTDARDIYAACFDGEGFAGVIFMSPSGTVLGTITVPAEYGFEEGEWRHRSAEELAAWWRRAAAG